MDRGEGGDLGIVQGSSAQAMAQPQSDDRSFAELYRRYHDRVWRTLMCLGVPEEALDDALQDVFVVVHRRMGEPDEYDSVRSWIYAVARRVAWHHYRTRSRHRRKLEAVQRQPSPTSPDNPEEAVAQREALTVVRRFLQQLDDGQRVVFVLADIEGLTAPEIAEVVDAKVSTVYSRLRLARKRFERIAATHQRRQQREEDGV